MTDLIFAATCDISGKVRGKAFPAVDLGKRLKRGVGWTPTNVQINCFDGIADSPFGALGDLLLIPDESTAVTAAFDSHVERFMLGDIMSLDGKPWDFCTRSLLKAALARLERVGGVRLLAAFEHEFHLHGRPAHESTLVGEGFGRTGFEERRAMCESLAGMIAGAGLSPDTIMKEYGQDQFEVAIGPEEGVRAADAAVIVRELARSTARAHGEKASFCPIRDPDSVGNGVHVHMSFLNRDGSPATYDKEGSGGMSAVTNSFVAGVLAHLDAILALTAPSVVSYLRLTPHRWSAAFNNLGLQDREAAIRICPVTTLDAADVAEQFNFEYRAADAAACPHLALAAIVHAGCQGIEEGLAAPPPTEEDLSLLTAEELANRGYSRLPETLEAALERFCASSDVTRCFPADFPAVYLAHKESEIAHLSGMDPQAQCEAYQDAY